MDTLYITVVHFYVGRWILFRLGDYIHLCCITTVPGANMDLKSPLSAQSSDWEKGQSIFEDGDSLPSIPASLYNSPENTVDDKTIADYEKGFRYGSNKDRLDEALENAVLKSEIYGDPSAINQYRYLFICRG